MVQLPNPFEFNPAECPADTAAACEMPPSGAAAVTTPAPQLPSYEEALQDIGKARMLFDASKGGNVRGITEDHRFALAEVFNKPEPFSEYARRRSMPIVSPPIAAPVEPDREWPRGFDPEDFLARIEPVPLFLRKQYLPARAVAPSLIRALFDLAGPER